jgi:hypothetical protein
LTIITSNISAILLAKAVKDNPASDPGIMYLIISLVSLFVFVLIFVFMKNRVIQMLRLWYITLVYGRYSYEFLTFFKANNLRSPHNGCIKDEIMMHLMVFYKILKNSQEFRTTTQVDFGRIPFMTKSQNLFKIKGKPNCMKVAIQNNIKLMVVGYHETLQGRKMRAMYFFLNDHFVMGEYLFSDLLHINPSQLVGTFSSKYLNGNPIEKDVFYIKDTKGNQLNYEHNGFSISIKYLFNGDQETNRILSDFFESGNTIPDNKTIMAGNEELLDRF